MEACRVVPMHPPEGRELEIIDRFPWAVLCRTPDKLGLVVAVHRLSEGIVIAVTDSSDRGRRPDLREAFTVTNGRELTARIAMAAQRREVLPPATIVPSRSRRAPSRSSCSTHIASPRSRDCMRQ